MGKLNRAERIAAREAEVKRLRDLGCDEREARYFARHPGMEQAAMKAPMDRLDHAHGMVKDQKI